MQLLKTLNCLMIQFTKIPSVPGEIYPKVNLCPKNIMISSDLLSKDIHEVVTEQDVSQVMDSIHSQMSQTSQETK